MKYKSMEDICSQNIKEIMIPMTMNQEFNIDCTPNSNDKFEAEYYSYVYSRPKKSVSNIFQNILECYGESDTDVSFRYYSSQAWDTFDRKLRGFEYEVPCAYDDNVLKFENRDSLYIDFTIKKDEMTVIIHAYYRNVDLYRESVNSTYGLFSNWRNKYVIDNGDIEGDYIRYSLYYLFLKVQKIETIYSKYFDIFSNILGEEFMVVLEFNKEIKSENKSKLYM